MISFYYSGKNRPRFNRFCEGFSEWIAKRGEPAYNAEAFSENGGTAMIRFFNGRTLTMAHGVTVTTDEVWTDGDKIAYIGPTPETLPAFERQIDLGGDLVMPGFKTRTRTPA